MKGTFFTSDRVFFNLKESLGVFCLFVLLFLEGVFVGQCSGLKFPNCLFLICKFIGTALILCSEELRSFFTASCRINFTLLQIGAVAPEAYFSLPCEQ